ANHVFAVKNDGSIVERDGDYNTGKWNDWATPAGGGTATSLTAGFTK
ncbi:hypothetical protein OV450_8544, partial [Actinobacteria bacterium OV450]